MEVEFLFFCKRDENNATLMSSLGDKDMGKRTLVDDL
jgi:hypothetical protein